MSALHPRTFAVVFLIPSREMPDSNFKVYHDRLLPNFVILIFLPTVVVDWLIFPVQNSARRPAILKELLRSFHQSLLTNAGIVN
jgi:hypothetical protein